MKRPPRYVLPSDLVLARSRRVEALAWSLVSIAGLAGAIALLLETLTH
jgi:hypothetical protein